MLSGLVSTWSPPLIRTTAPTLVPPPLSTPSPGRNHASFASSRPLAGAAFIFVWRLKHSNTYDQARARTSRACSEVRPASGLNVVSAPAATVDVPLHVLVEGETVDSYRLANPGRPDLSGVY